MNHPPQHWQEAISPDLHGLERIMLYRVVLHAHHRRCHLGACSPGNVLPDVRYRLLNVWVTHPAGFLVGRLWYPLTRSTGLAKGTVQGGRRKGRQKKRWEDRISEWTGLGLGAPFERLRTERNGEKWLPCHPRCPNGHSDYGMSVMPIISPIFFNLATPILLLYVPRPTLVVIKLLTLTKFRSSG